MSSTMYVRVKTLDCPRCGKSDVLNLTRKEFNALRDHSGPKGRGQASDSIQEILPRLKPEIRERFLSGYCPECWDIMFPDDEEPTNEYLDSLPLEDEEENEP